MIGRLLDRLLATVTGRVDDEACYERGCGKSRVAKKGMLSTEGEK